MLESQGLNGRVSTKPIEEPARLRCVLGEGCSVHHLAALASEVWQRLVDRPNDPRPDDADQPEGVAEVDLSQYIEETKGCYSWAYWGNVNGDYAYVERHSEDQESGKWAQHLTFGLWTPVLFPRTGS